MKTLVITLILCTACGSQSESDTAPAVESNSEKSKAPSKEYAIVVDNKLPFCDDTSLDALVYQKSTSTFFRCEDRIWVRIDLSGKDGKDGVNGKDGLNGQDGEKGASGIAGSNGVDGINGQDGEPLPSGLWLDAVTGSTWLIGSPTLTLPNAVLACGSPYRMPTEAEAVAAVSHGILIGQAQSMWINYHETDLNSGMWINPSLTVSGIAVAGNPTKGTFCIEE